MPARSSKEAGWPTPWGRQRIQHDLHVQVEVSGHLARPGGTAVALGQFGGGVVDA
jgi:hypothetical protein